MRTTVRELIAQLQALENQDWSIVTVGYEGGYSDAGIGEKNWVWLKRDYHNADQWYYSPHERADEEKDADEPAYILPR